MGRPGRRAGLTKPRQNISIQLPVEMIEEINEMSDSMGISRTRWFELVAREALGDKAPVRRRTLAWGGELAG